MKLGRKTIFLNMMFILFINTIAYTMKTSQYASEEAKQMSVFTIPILTILGLVLGLLLGYILTRGKAIV